MLTTQGIMQSNVATRLWLKTVQAILAVVLADVRGLTHACSLAKMKCKASIVAKFADGQGLQIYLDTLMGRWTLQRASDQLTNAEDALVSCKDHSMR